VPLRRARADRPPAGSWTESFLPPDGYAMPAGAAAAGSVPWIEDFDRGLAEARRSGKNMFVDFSESPARTAARTRSPSSASRGLRRWRRGVVPVKLYTDRLSAEHKEGDAANRRRMEQLGSVSLPLYVPHVPDGKALKVQAMRPARPSKTFTEFLEAPPR